MTAPLDNPVWRALTGPHAELALGRGQARLEGRSDGIPVGRKGKPMRAAVGGSKTLIASSVKVAPAAVESVCGPASLDHGCSDKQSKHSHQP
jgi:hypothetical protein